MPKIERVVVEQPMRIGRATNSEHTEALIAGKKGLAFEEAPLGVRMFVVGADDARDLLALIPWPMVRQVIYAPAEVLPEPPTKAETPAAKAKS